LISTEEKFEECIQKAVKEFEITEEDAVGALVIYMCQSGTIDEFKDFINYYMKNQDRWNFN
jgi:hypothetical protein